MPDSKPTGAAMSFLDSFFDSLSFTETILVSVGGCFVICLGLFTIWVWPVLIGRKPVLTCEECDAQGILRETGAKEKTWLQYRREYICEHCGHKKWVSDLSGNLLRPHGGIYLCPKCEKAPLCTTGVKKRRFVYRLIEGECGHCGYREWYKDWSSEGGGGG